MRILLKPEISTWNIFNFGGTGFMGDFWLPPLIVLFALVGFYLEGRGKLRILFHILLISWNLLMTGVIAYGSLQPDAKASFGAWGVSISFIWFIVPFVLFLFLAISLVVQEIRGNYTIPSYDWAKINWKYLVIALLLFPVALLFFQLGTGFNWLAKIAVAATIIQWILLTEAVSRPNGIKLKNDQ